VQVRFSLFFITVEVLTTRKEEVEGVEIHINNVASSLRLVSTGQNINDEAQPVVSQAEGVTSIWPRYRIPRRLFCSVTGNDAPEISDHVSGSTNDRLTRTEPQTRACFFTIVEISMT
jgi:hypothetical protein